MNYFTVILKIKSHTQQIILDLKLKQHPKLLLFATLIILILLIYLGNHHQASKKHNINKIPVTVATAQTQNVPVYINALGTVTAKLSVTIKTQVNGKLLKLLPKDGEQVTKGQIIAEIDPAPYKAQVEQYQGQLERDIALLENAKIDLQRYQILWSQNAISKQILDTQKSLLQQYEAAVKSDQGLLDNSKINLSYCTITSPIDGKIGIDLLSEGNLIQISDTTPISTINNLDIVYVTFAIPETELPKVLEQFKELGNLKVESYDYKQDKLLAVGNLYAINNQIDNITGTITLKAEFSNKDRMLFINQFVNVKLLIDTLENAIVVPTSAIQHGPQGNFVYLVQNDNKVHIQMVTTGVTDLDNTVIISGVSENQQVVIEGVDKLINGSSVLISATYGSSP